MARKPAHSMGSSASAVSRSFGIHSVATGHTGEQSSYLSATLALVEKIISSSPEALIWSTDHVSNNKHTPAAAFLARYLGGHRRRPIHRPRCRGRVSPRSVVTCDVTRP